MKQYEQKITKDNNSGVLENRGNENESNICKNPKQAIQAAYYISKTRRAMMKKEKVQMKGGHTKCKRGKSTDAIKKVC